MNKIPCSVGILTFNSGKTLKRALESVKDFSEIIICDGGSTDDTLDIVREFGCKIIYQDEKYKNKDNSLKDYSGVRNQCLDASSYDWFFYIDSDEFATIELVNEIKEITLFTDIKYYVYNISPRLVLDEKLIKYSSNYPGWQKRFFNKKSGAKFIKPIHERIEYDKNIYEQGYLNGNWYYFVYSKDTPEKIKKYAQMDAKLLKTKLSFTLILKILITALKTVIKSSLIYLRYGFKDSLPISAEWSRVAYQLYIIYFLIFRRK